MVNEVKRQLFHLTGIGYVVASYFFPRTLFALMLFFLLIVASVACFLRPLPRQLGIVKTLFDYLHNLARDEEKKLGIYFGAATFSLGAFLTYWIFGAEIFRVAILVLAAGDSFSTLIGLPYGKHKLFYNKLKSWEGFIAGTMAAFAACLFVAPLHIALIAAFVGMAVESSPAEVNDNLTIPLAVALVMTALKFLPL